MRNNRTAGNRYERTVVNDLKSLGFDDVVTARSESRNMDNRGVDVFGDSLPIHIQCKTTNRRLKYEDFFQRDTLPTDKPVVIYEKKTRKSNSRFMTIGEFVIMRREDFERMVLTNDNK